MSERSDGLTYRSWQSMKQRCLNPKAPKYHRYGGRGIRICERWINSFAGFLADMGPRPSLQHSLERSNTAGNYEPNNCVWATAIDQNNNRPAFNRTLMVNGERVTVAQASKMTGVPHPTICGRLDAGKSDDDAVSTTHFTSPFKSGKFTTTKFVCIDGVTTTVAEAASARGLKYTTVLYRLRRGWPVEKALSHV